MPTTIPDLTAAVYSEVADSGIFGSGDTVRRSWLPREDVRDMAVGAFLVTVTPQGQDAEILNRGSMMRTVTIAIAIQCRVEDFGNATIDPMVEQSESVLAYMFGRELTDAPEALFLGANMSPIMSPLHADDFSVFTSVVTVRYKIAESM